MIRIFSYVFCLLPFLLTGQMPTITATLSKSLIAVNEPFNLTITLQNTTEDDELMNPDFGELRLVGGPQVSTEYYNINGKESGKASYTFTLASKAEKTFTLGPFTVIHRGKKYSSNKVIVTAKGNYKPPTGAVQQSQQTQSSQSTTTEGDFFVALDADKKNYYLGEQVIVFLKLFHRVDLNVPSIENIETPGFAKVFRIEDFNKQPTLVTIKGKRYVSRTLECFGLFTHNSGEFTIPAIVANFSSVDPWSFYGSKTIQKSTKSLVFNVKPLPQPQPANFTGAIGKYEANFNIEKDKIEVGKSLLVTINLQGNGDESMAIGQPWPSKDLWESFGPNEVANHIFEDQNVRKHSKVIQYQLIPSKDTTLQVAPTFIYFDTETGTYQDAIKTTKQVAFIPSTNAKSSAIDNLPTHIDSESKINWQGGMLGLLAGLSIFGIWVWWKRRRNNTLKDISTADQTITRQPDANEPILSASTKVVATPRNVDDVSSYMPAQLKENPIQDIEPSIVHKAIEPIQDNDINDSNEFGDSSHVNFDEILDLWQQALRAKLDVPFQQLDRSSIVAGLALKQSDDYLKGEYFAIQNALDAIKYGGAPLGDVNEWIERIKKWREYTD